MNTELVTIIGLQVFLFLVVLVIMLCQNHALLRSADHRLAKANEMVLKLASSADKLADSVSTLKDFAVQIKANDEQHLIEIQRNRDDFKESYIKLLHKYETLEDMVIDKYKEMQAQSFNTVVSMATTPNIANTNLTGNAE